MSNFRRLLLALFLCMLCPLDEGLSKQATKQQMPRSFGPISLGMTIESFRKVAPVQPNRCHHCANDELSASFLLKKDKATDLNLTRIVKLEDAHIEYQPRTLQPEIVECFFYKGKLYGITLMGVKDKIESVKSRYMSTLGKPAANVDFGTGISQLRWETDLTRLTVSYSTSEKDVDDLQIIYSDKQIMATIPPVHE